MAVFSGFHGKIEGKAGKYRHNLFDMHGLSASTAMCED